MSENNNNKHRRNTQEAKRLFIVYYKNFGSVGEAATKAGIKSRKTVYRWVETDPKFAEIYSELKDNREDQIKSQLYRAAMGELSLTSPQVTSAIFLLKAFNPKQFAEKYQLGGIPGGEPVDVRVTEIEKVKDRGDSD